MYCLCTTLAQQTPSGPNVSRPKAAGPLGKRLLNVYSLCRSGNPPPAPQSGSEIRRSICSVNGALRGAIGVFDNRYLYNRPSSPNGTNNDPLTRSRDSRRPEVVGTPRRRLSPHPPGASPFG
jgi:hypothetical protein